MTRHANRKGRTRTDAAVAGKSYTSALRDQPGRLAGLKALVDQAGGLDPAWSHLITALAEAKARLTMYLAAHQAAETAASQITAACGSIRGVPVELAVTIEQIRTERDTEAETARLYYIALAGHALAVAAGEANLWELPDDNQPRVGDPETHIPRSLSGYDLVELRAAVPDYAAADQVQEEFEREFGAEDSSQASAAQEDVNAMYDRLDHQAIAWADAACAALLGELRPRLEAD